MISAEEQAFLLLLQTSQAGPSTTSVCIYRQHSVFWQKVAVCITAVGFIFNASVTVISINFRYIIVCSGSRTSTESVSAVCWCGVEMGIRTGVMKTFDWLLNNLNCLKKYVEDISVDAVSGCKFCSDVLI